jgi:hypothetical protein
MGQNVPYMSLKSLIGAIECTNQKSQSIGASHIF